MKTECAAQKKTQKNHIPPTMGQNSAEARFSKCRFMERVQEINITLSENKASLRNRNRTHTHTHRVLFPDGQLQKLPREGRFSFGRAAALNRGVCFVHTAEAAVLAPLTWE